MTAHRTRLAVVIPLLVALSACNDEQGSAVTTTTQASPKPPVQIVSTIPASEAPTSTTAPADAGGIASLGDRTPPVLPGADDDETANPFQTGRWRPFRTARSETNLTAEQREMMDRLESIGYASGSREARTEVGVTVHDRERACPGTNLYTSGHAQQAILMDMAGRVLHRWSYDFWDIWPDFPVRGVRNTRYWRRAHVFENGDILVIYEGIGIIKLDKDSNLIWARLVRAHHDLDLMPDGNICVLTRKSRIVPHLHPRNPVLEDFISILGPGGKERKRVSLLKCCESSEFRDALLHGRTLHGDIFHTNTVQVLDGRIADLVPAFARGNVLTCLRHLDAIAVVDLEQEKLVWVYQGAFSQPHDPKVLENGNLLLFDNRGQDGQSGVMELDPVSKETKWLYRGTPEAPFYSQTCGTADRLPNGNTLITESDNGRAFEVTPDKTIVWEFCNPHRAGENEEFIATLFELVRLEPGFPLDWAHHQPQE